MEMLVDALKTGDRIVQAEAARLLGELKRPEAVEPLVDYVTHCRYHAKATGFHALAEIGDRSVCARIRPLVDLPNCSDDWYWYGCKSVRTAAAVALLRLVDEAGAGYLRQQADAADDVFYAWFGPAILRLSDELPAAREMKARITVEALHGEGARRTRITEPGIVTMVSEALGLIGTEEACAALRTLLGWRSRYTRGQAALSLMAAAPTEENRAAVAEVAANDATDFGRVKASLALALAGDAGRLDAVVAAATGPDDAFDRAVAIESLGLAGHAEHVSVAERALNEDDEYVRQCAVEALERLGADADCVAACRHDASIRVRMQAEKFFAAVNGGPQQ